MSLRYSGQSSEDAVHDLDGTTQCRSRESKAVRTEHKPQKKPELDKCITKGSGEKAHYCLKPEKI